MKNTIFKKTIIALLILLLACTSVFAKGGKEKDNANAEEVSVAVETSDATVSESAGKTEDSQRTEVLVSENTQASAAGSADVSENAQAEKNANVAAGDELKRAESAAPAEKAQENAEIEAFMGELKDFSDKYETLIAKMEMAYDKDDAVAYKKAKEELRNLESDVPELTRERTEKIAASLSDSDYENANWLYVNSDYYCPVLRFVSSSENFSYSSSFTANPGTEVSIPAIDGPNGRLLFQGWSLTEGGDVAYKADDKIKMPVKDMTLYAVFAPNPDIREGRHLTFAGASVRGAEGLTLPQGKQTWVKAELKNTGSENLRNVEIKFESDDPLFVTLTDPLHCRVLPCADDVEARFKVITKAAPGTSLKGTLTVSDGEGVLLTEDVVFTVQ